MQRELRDLKTVQGGSTAAQDMEIMRMDRICDEIGGRLDTLDEELVQLDKRLESQSQSAEASMSSGSSSSAESAMSLTHQALIERQWHADDWMGTNGAFCRRSLRELGIYSYSDLHARWNNAMHIDVSERVYSGALVTDMFHRLHPMASEWFQYSSLFQQSPLEDYQHA